MSRSLRAASQPRAALAERRTGRDETGQRPEAEVAATSPRTAEGPDPAPGPIHSPDVTIWAYRLHESSTSAHHARLHQHPGACMNDDDLFRNGDTLNNIPVIRDE